MESPTLTRRFLEKRYLKTLPLIGFLLLLNCRWSAGNLQLNWYALSWYLTSCYLLYPLTAPSQPQRRATSAVPPVHAMTYAAGLPLTPLRDYDDHEVRLLPGLALAFLRFLLAPIFVIIRVCRLRH